MRQQVTDEFTQVSVTAGTLQNVSEFRNIEVASTQEKGTGIILKPLERIQFLEDTTVYVRTFGDNNGASGRAYFTTEPFKLKVGRGNVKKRDLNLNRYCINNIPNYKSITKLPEATIKDLTNIVLKENAMAAFTNCSLLTTLSNVEKTWDTSKVTDMRSMFYWCGKLISLDVSKWDTSEVTTMREMFRSCASLISLDVSKWNTSKLTDMYMMFAGCSSLTSFDASKWDVSKVTNMDRLFMGCRKLTTVSMSNTENVQHMWYMFGNCSKLTTIQILDTAKATDMRNMFDSCSSLPNTFPWTINCSSITDAGNLEGMFSGTPVTKVTLKGVKSTIKSKVTSALLKGASGLSITFVT